MPSDRNTSQPPAWTLGDRLRKARESAGLTQRDLAIAMGVSRSTVSAAESGLRPVQKITLNAWALVTAVDLSWICTDDCDQAAAVSA